MTRTGNYSGALTRHLIIRPCASVVDGSIRRHETGGGGVGRGAVGIRDAWRCLGAHGSGRGRGGVGDACDGGDHNGRERRAPNGATRRHHDHRGQSRTLSFVIRLSRASITLITKLTGPGRCAAVANASRKAPRRPSQSSGRRAARGPVACWSAGCFRCTATT